MRVAVLGTGTVGPTLAGKLRELGHEAAIGSRAGDKGDGTFADVARGADSLAEQIQREFPELRVVKSLNTVNAGVMVDPVGTMFVAGNDEGAKATVVDLLRAFGWEDILDLGGIEAARGMEMYLPLWLRLWGAIGKAGYNVAVVRG